MINMLLLKKPPPCADEGGGNGKETTPAYSDAEGINGAGIRYDFKYKPRLGAPL